MKHEAPTAAVDAYIGLGANLGDPVAALRAAVQALAALPGTALVATSGLYASAPVDAQGPEFINAVAHLRTSLAPQELLLALQAVESDAGRQRPYRHAPRTLDLDLLLHGNTVCQTPQLTLPHPRLHLRRFVLAPLLELAPQLQLPGLGPAQRWLPAAAEQAVRRLPG
jgi:2-amino-4-hydroxy-6-hydroxymethyldihydropteridine diphosphokinase